MTQTTPPKHLVLYADDDNDDLMFVQEAFSESGFNVELVTVNDGLEAINYLNRLSPLEGTPCLIILDVNMPRLNGKETLEKIRKIDKFIHIPVVLFTTSALEMDKKFAQKFNAGFVTKPLDSRQMKVITNKFIDHCSDEVQRIIRRQMN